MNAPYNHPDISELITLALREDLRIASDVTCMALVPAQATLSGVVTALLTTHDMQDIEALSHRVVVIDHGRIMHDGGLEELKHRYGARKRLEFTLREAVDFTTLTNLPTDNIAWSQTNSVELVAALEARVDTAQILQQCFALLPIADIRIEEPAIEQVVAALYGGRSG